MHYSTGESPILKQYAGRISHSVRSYCNLAPGWASRPAYGASFGRNTVEKYKAELMEMYMNGAHDKTKRMSAFQMIERLRASYPNRYDIPSEQFVIRFITTQNTRLKTILKRGGAVGDLCTEVYSQRKRIPQNVVQALEQLIRESNGTLQPRFAYDKLIELLQLDKLNLPDWLPSEKTIKSKVSNLKAAMKKA